MAKSANATANEKFRTQIMEKLVDFFRDMGEDVQITASNEICFPFVNELRSDEWLRITAAIPTGSRKDREPFDGYEKAEDFKRKQEEATERAKKAAEAKAKKQAFDKKKREIAAKKEQTE